MVNTAYLFQIDYISHTIDNQLMYQWQLTTKLYQTKRRSLGVTRSPQDVKFVLQMSRISQTYFILHTTVGSCSRGTPRRTHVWFAVERSRRTHQWIGYFPRGAGFTFGANISQQWNEQNGLELVASKSSSTHYGWIKLKSWTTSHDNR
jgi:hypothetical protein